MNYIILFATGYILKIKMKHWRLLLSSLLGGVYAVVSYLEILPVYSHILTKIMLSVGMVYLAFYAKGIKILLKQIILFYLISFVFGGCAFALLYFIKPQDILMKNGVYVGTYPLKIAVLGGLIGFILTYIAFKIVKTKLKKKDMIYQISIKLNNKSLNLKAMLDTGNLLKEPITGMPVIVVEKQELSSIIPMTILEHIEEIVGGDAQKVISQEEKEYLTKFRVIPFSSIGKENGLMLGLKADEVMIEKEEEKEVREDIIIGIFPQTLSKNHTYTALIGLDLLERNDIHEFTTNFKVKY
ncbi:MAG: sigma-E processing peptidase SpoIIGA [Clostridia bacterium]|nr:sigma-E processing peptidase SpoIIGA [Clostridia bacterium]